MNGKKTRDFYYMQLQNLSGFGDISDANFDSINKCVKTAKVYRMLEDIDSEIDMTRCVGEFQQKLIKIYHRIKKLLKTTFYSPSIKLCEAYRVCRKEPDWSIDVPPTAEPTAPVTDPTTFASTESPITDVPITDAPITGAPINDLPDFNDLSQVSNY